MIFLERKDIDVQRWNKLIKESENGLIYAYSWFLDVLCDWDALIKISNSGDYEVVCPLPTKSKFGFKYIYPPFFIQQLGLFGNVLNSDVEEAIEYISNNYSFSELYFNYSNIVDGQSMKNLVLNLDKDDEGLFDAFSKNHKRNIKKSTSYGLEFIELDSVDEIVDIFRLQKGKEVRKWGDDEYKRLKDLCKESKENDSLSIYGVQKDGVLISGGCFFIDNKRVTFLFSGTSETGKEYGALFFLLWKAIQYFSKEFDLFDFEGSNSDGLYRFYQGFGAVEQNYSFLKVNNLPFYLRWLK